MPHKNEVETETQLLPCPFCGGGAEVYPEDSDYGYYVSCFQPSWPIEECYCSLGEEYDRDAMPEHRFLTKEAAIAAWNTRNFDERSALLARVQELKEIVVIAVTLHHGGCYEHQAHNVPYEECQSSICARARAALKGE